MAPEGGTVAAATTGPVVPLASWARAGSATSATASSSPPARCWSPRSPATPSWWQLAWTLQYLPWLVFGLFAGVIADRVDRLVLIAVADSCRVAVLAVLVTTVVTGQVDIAVVLAAMFLLGVGETFADTTTATLLPMVVDQEDLGLGNARMIAGTVTLNQLVGPPLGALLFGLGRAWPFLTRESAWPRLLLVLRVRLPAHGRDEDDGPTTMRRDIARGAAVAVAPRRRAHPDDHDRGVQRHLRGRLVGAGALLDRAARPGRRRVRPADLVAARRGVVGTFSYGWLERHVSLANLMRGGLLVETLTHLGLALTTRPAVALALFFVFGIHAFVWGTTSSARAPARRAHPRPGAGAERLHDRGDRRHRRRLARGWAVASRWGVTAPFWFAFGGSVVILALCGVSCSTSPTPTRRSWPAPGAETD